MNNLFNTRRRYTLTYHYLGDSSKTYTTIQFCMTLIDAINLTMSDVNWQPILFDSYIEENN